MNKKLAIGGVGSTSESFGNFFGTSLQAGGAQGLLLDSDESTIINANELF